jgi:hypothetical protein
MLFLGLGVYLDMAVGVCGCDLHTSAFQVIEHTRGSRAPRARFFTKQIEPALSCSKRIGSLNGTLLPTMRTGHTVMQSGSLAAEMLVLLNAVQSSPPAQCLSRHQSLSTALCPLDNRVKVFVKQNNGASRRKHASQNVRAAETSCRGEQKRNNRADCH